MENKNTQLQINDSFFVVKNGFEHFINDEVFSDLYLPILGIESYSLYNKLITFDKNDVASHFDLLETIHLNLNSFISAREKLEAISLLKTYLIVDDNKVYEYVLRTVPTANEFFKDPLLSGLLKHEIGEIIFDKLLNKYVKKPKKGIDISAKFFDVFNDANIANFSERKELDYSDVENRLINSSIDINEIKRVMPMIKSLVSVFGYSKEEVSQMVIDSIDLSTHKIKDNFVISEAKITEKLDSVKIPDSESASLSENEKALLDEANNFDNYQFLKLIKQIYNGIPTQIEQDVLINLSQRGLKKEVINVLVYEAVNSNDEHFISARFIETLVDYLSKNNAINSAQSAITGLKNRRNAPTRKNSRVVEKIDYSSFGEISSDDKKNAEKEISDLLNKIENRNE